MAKHRTKRHWWSKPRSYSVEQLKLVVASENVGLALAKADEAIVRFQKGT